MAKARTLKKTRKFNGKTYRKHGVTHTKKTAAKKSAKAFRSKSSAKKARVVHSKAGWSVYTRG